MTRHHLDGNAIAADKHYGREEPAMRECDQCDGTGTHLDPLCDLLGNRDQGRPCHVCGGSGEVPVEQEEPEARDRDE